MHRPLRIGIFMDDFFPKSGGVARSIELQIDELVRRGHSVVLFAPRPFFIAPENCPSEALESWYLPGTQSFLCSVKFGKKTVDRLLKKYDFDVVHSQNERGSLFLAAKIAKQRGIPHVHTFHSNYAGTHRTSPILSAINSLTYLRLAPRIMKKIRPERSALPIYLPRTLTAPERSRLARADWKNVAKLARYTDAFTSPADFVISAIVDASRERLAERGHTVGNGVSGIFKLAERIRPLENTLRFISCGRLDPEKRVDVIIKAFAKLNRADTELYILGTGSDEVKLKKLARDTVRKGSVVFLGHYNDIERIANEYANADVFVFASYRFDTQGMVLAEAAASGTPILYCDDRLHIGVSPDNALLVNPSVGAFEDGMRYFMNNRGRHANMVQASKKIGKTVTADVMEEKFLALYRQVIEHPYVDDTIN